MKTWMVIALVATVSGCGPVRAQSQPTPVPANALVPRAPRSAPISAWTADAGRSLLSANVDGAVLRGYAFRGSDPRMRLTVLFFGGSGGSLNGAGFPAVVAQLGPNVDAYDYRGFGWSSGTAEIGDLREDSLKLFDITAAAAGGPAHVVVLGYSFGTPLAAYVASARPVRGLVLISSLSTLKEQLTFLLTTTRGMSPQEANALPYSEGALIDYDVTKMVAQSTAPLLVIHGEADRNVSVAEGREVYAAAAGTPKRLVTIPNATHNAPGQPESLDAIKAFLNTLR